MGHTLRERIRNEAEFKKLLNTLALDLGRVADYLTLFNKLLDARQTQYTSAFVQSQTFWSLVLGSLHDAALHGLARAYDQKNDALTLRTLVETIKAGLKFLPNQGEIDRHQLELDLKSVSRGENVAVKHLMMWRHKFLAHRDAWKIISNRTLADDYPLTWAEIDGLLDTGFAILNRYSMVLFRNSFTRRLVGADDYLDVLNALQTHEEAVSER